MLKINNDPRGYQKLSFLIGVVCGYTSPCTLKQGGNCHVAPMAVGDGVSRG